MRAAVQTIGYAALQIVPSMKGATKSIEGDLGSLGKTGDSAGSRIGGALRKGLKWGAVGVLGITTAVGALAATGGVNRALAIEGAQAKLTGLGHDAASVTAIMGNALASVRGTAYGLGDASAVAASLVASGVKAGGELEGVLKTVADTSAISGRTLTDIGTIFGSVAARGKLQGDDMLQLMSSGVPVLQLVAKQLGVTSAAASDLVSKGKVDFATFAAAMKDGLGGAALSSGTTFTGALSNVYAALGRLGAVAATPALGMLKGLFNQAIPVIDQLTASITPVVDALAARLAPAVEGLGARFATLASGIDGSGLLAAFDRITGKASDFGGLLAVLSPLGAVLKGALPALSSMGAAFTQIGVALGRVLAAALPSIADAFVALAAAVGGSLVTILPTVAGVLGELAAVIPTLGPPLLALVPPLAALVVEVVKLLTPLLASREALLVAAGAFVAWKAATAGIALAGLIAQLWATVTAFTAKAAAMVADKAATVALSAMYAGDFVRSMASSAAAIARNSAAWIAHAAVATAQAVRMAAAWAVGVIAPAAAAAAAMVAQVARQVAAWVLLGTQSLLQAARVAAAWLIAMGPVGLVIAAVIGLVAVIVANWDKIVAVTTEVWTKVTGWLASAWESIKTTAVNVWNGILGWLRSNWPLVVGIITGPIGLVIALVVKNWDKVKTTTVNAWNGVVNAVRNGVTGAVDWVKGLPGRTLAALGNLGNLLVNAGRNILDGFLRGLKAGFEKVKSFVGGIGSWIADHKGPKAYDLALLQPAGRWIMQGLRTGIADSLPQLRQDLEGVSRTIAAGVDITPRTPSLPSPRTLDNANGSIGEGNARVVQHVTINYPVAEPQSTATNRALQYAGALGEG